MKKGERKMMTRSPSTKLVPILMIKVMAVALQVQTGVEWAFKKLKRLSYETLVMKFRR